MEYTQMYLYRRFVSVPVYPIMGFPDGNAWFFVWVVGLVSVMNMVWIVWEIVADNDYMIIY